MYYRQKAVFYPLNYGTIGRHPNLTGIEPAQGSSGTPIGRVTVGSGLWSFPHLTHTAYTNSATSGRRRYSSLNASSKDATSFCMSVS